MSVTDSGRILKVISAFNPWWKTGGINGAFSKQYKRFAFYEAMKRLDQEDIRRTILLSGARRVGKTTIEYQMIRSLLSRGVPADHIVFISLDHPILKFVPLDEILDIYHQNICPTQDVYYFFDEIQYAEDWDRWLKVIYDSQPDTHVIATGSASPVLIKGNAESGTGRWSVIPVPTLSFYEYCSLIGIPEIGLDPSVDPWTFSQMTRPEQTRLMLLLNTVQNHFARYLQVGGFPELALAKEDALALQTMREDVVDKVLKRDIPALYNIRNVAELERIFLYLCNVSSEIVSVDAIAKELNGVSRPTVENYIRYLESANLIYISDPIDLDGRKPLKIRSKIYIADAAIRNAVLMDDDLLTNADEMGKVIETAVYKHVLSSFHARNTRIGYYRGGKKDKEIDIVIDPPRKKRIMIEVKYREQATIKEDDAIRGMSSDAVTALVVTKRADDYGTVEMENGTTMIRMPAFAFLYLLGHAERLGI